MSNLPKMLSKREIELEELEDAKYVQSLRDEVKSLKSDNETLKKALREIMELDCSDDCYFTARDALAAIEKGENNEI